MSVYDRDLRYYGSDLLTGQKTTIEELWAIKDHRFSIDLIGDNDIM